MKKAMNTEVKPFDALNNEELYRILKLRFDVFVLEQDCMYNEFDFVDFSAKHLFIRDDEKVVAHARLYLKKEGVASFGRVVVHPDYRKQGLGREIVAATLQELRRLQLAPEVLISAQTYLKAFYESFGFVQCSEEYDDEGIPHIDMQLCL
jgi:ElaA protein